MRIILIVENKSLQFKLTPENEQEKKLIEILNGYSGEAKIETEDDGSMYHIGTLKHLIVTIFPEEH